jgi:prepilin peptidase CpaA
MVMVALYDMTTMTIPNWISLILIGGFFVIAILAGMDLASLGLHAAVSAGTLVLGFALFAFGVFGGGDAKILAASSLWVGWSSLFPYLIAVTFAGGILSLLLLGARRFPLPEFLMAKEWISRLHNSETGVPYGIALAIGGLTVFTNTIIFKLAVA